MGFPVHIPFVERLGFEFIGWSQEGAEIAVEQTDELCNSWGVMHGGVTMTLLDVVMAHAMRRSDPGGLEAAQGAATVEMKTTFMRPGIGRLVAKGRVLHRTPSLAFCEASVHDAEGRLVAHATGTFKALKALPAGGRRVLPQRADD